MWAIGLMSGTSCDGIDAALIHTDGTAIDDFGPTIELSYDVAFRARLQSCFGGKGPVAAVERELTERHADAVRQLLAEAGRKPSRDRGRRLSRPDHPPRAGAAADRADRRRRAAGEADRHRRGERLPQRRRERRAGRARRWRRSTTCALADRLAKPVAVLNLGGVGNVTWIGDDGTLIAFDTGPGNALLDDWALRHTGTPLDVDGALAKSGRPIRGRAGQAEVRSLFRAAGAEIPRPPALQGAGRRRARRLERRPMAPRRWWPSRSGRRRKRCARFPGRRASGWCAAAAATTR